MQKNKRKIAMNRIGGIGIVNDTGVVPVKTSRITKKLATRELKIRKKKFGRDSVATRGGYSHASYTGSADSSNGENLRNDQFNSETQRAESQLENTSAEEFNYSEYGNPAIIASERDWKLVIDTIENPPDPSPKMLEAVKRYKEAVESGQLRP